MLYKVARALSVRWAAATSDYRYCDMDLCCYLPPMHATITCRKIWIIVVDVDGATKEAENYFYLSQDISIHETFINLNFILFFALEPFGIFSLFFFDFSLEITVLRWKIAVNFFVRFSFINFIDVLLLGVLWDCCRLFVLKYFGNILKYFFNSKKEFKYFNNLY